MQSSLVELNVEVKAGTETVEQPGAAGAAVFDTTELLEMILVEVGMKTLLLARRVTRKWRDVIQQSDKLQKKLFLKPATLEEALALITGEDQTWKLVLQYEGGEYTDFPGHHFTVIGNPLLFVKPCYQTFGLQLRFRELMGKVEWVVEEDFIGQRLTDHRYDETLGSHKRMRFFQAPQPFAQWCLWAGTKDIMACRLVGEPGVEVASRLG